MTGSGDGQKDPVRRRLVLFFPGFEPLGAEQHRGRFEHALKKSGPLYGARYCASELQIRPSGMPGFTVTGTGEDWQTQTEIVIFDWSPVLEHFAARNVAVRFGAGLSAMLGFLFRGTLFRYLRTSWRYGLFFAYPLVMLAACLTLAVAAAHVFGYGMVGLLAGFSIFMATVAFASWKAHLLLMMDDWAFASHLAKGGHALTEDTLKTFRRTFQSELKAAGSENLVIGHSLGCIFAVDALSSSMATKPDAASLLTTGSSLLKIALDQKAGWLRDHIGNLAKSGVLWLDVQSLTDPISFYGSNPVVSSGFDSPPGLKTLRIRFRSMLSPQTYKKVKFNLFRTHRQFVLSGEKPYFYSMHQIACGPDPFEMVWESGGLPDQVRLLREQK
jgi:hypothetical protein